RIAPEARQKHRTTACFARGQATPCVAHHVTSRPSPSQSPKRSSDSFSRPGSLAGVGLAARFQDLINETPFLCFLGRHEAVTLQRLFYFVQLAARVFNIDLVQ